MYRSKLETDIVLKDETSEIARDLCAFGPIGEGGGVPQLLSNSFVIIYVCTRDINVKSELTQCATKRKAFIYKYHRLFINL